MGGLRKHMLYILIAFKSDLSIYITSYLCCH